MIKYINISFILYPVHAVIGDTAVFFKDLLLFFACSLMNTEEVQSLLLKDCFLWVFVQDTTMNPQLVPYSILSCSWIIG